MTKENSDSVEKRSYEIDMQSLYGGFETHLNIPDNNSVFFSGKYGTGKTTFLKHFFAQFDEMYDVYHLYPINYQIKSNEDVLDLLKYDILSTLLEKHPMPFPQTETAGIVEHAYLWKKFIGENYTLNSAIQYSLDYMEEALSPITAPVGIPIQALKKPLSDILNLNEKFREFRIKHENGDYEKVENFLGSIQTNESDGLSYIISKKVREMQGNKRSVLILDDLDRMDPEHIFRILNVFSAFHEQDNGGNKFGFDTVILVGDIANIRHIFEHFYGVETDFNGYIDKFYSYDVYVFSHHEIITHTIKQMVKEFGTDDTGKLLDGFEKGYFVSQQLIHLLIELSYTDEYNLRQLLKLLRNKKQLMVDSRFIQPTEFDTQDESAFKSVCFALRTMEKIITKQNTIKALENFRDRGMKDDERQVSDRSYIRLNEIILPVVQGEGAIGTNRILEQYGIGYIDGVIEYSDVINDLPRKLYFQLLLDLMQQNLYEK